ncbi:uncharacterized protein LODBEIA_P04120 [Lodderomyces beijingensis]|uniref:F-box domain-containing protein n=1 Tax=Lodderomyces beijingensis TaxID=1775926 RepID=A0ABP0ZDD8_9ASCO
MASLERAPLELLQYIIYKHLKRSSSDPFEYQSTLARIAPASALMRHISTEILYRDITIYNDDNNSILEQQGDRTFIHISHLTQFVHCLTLDNFLKIRSIHIHCRSNFNKFEYSELYNKLLHFWTRRQHCIELINFDIDNMRKNQTILQQLAKHSCEVVEENDEVDLQSSYGSKGKNKLANLSNWSILNAQELSNLPLTSPSLKTLDIFVEAVFGDEFLPHQHLQLQNLQQLNLNTTLSTQCFLQLNLCMPSLKKVSISYSHSFNKPAIDFKDYQRMIDFNQLTDLELKFNCLHDDCTCINQFYHNLAHQANDDMTPNFSKLKKLTIINHNSKNQVSNLQQYVYLISNQFPALFNKFPNLEYLYLNVNEFIKNDQCKINWDNFVQSIKLLPNLRDLTIVDFFKWWIPTIQLTRASLINTCGCDQCQSIRQEFQKMALHDEKNHFTHNFTDFVSESNHEPAPSHLDMARKCNSKFLSYLFTAHQSQFHQSIIYSMSTFYFRKVFGDGHLLTQFQELLRHNQLNKLAQKLKDNNNRLVINFGGVLV